MYFTKRHSQWQMINIEILNKYLFCNSIMLQTYVWDQSKAPHYILGQCQQNRQNYSYLFDFYVCHICFVMSIGHGSHF